METNALLKTPQGGPSLRSAQVGVRHGRRGRPRPDRLLTALPRG